MIESPSSTDQLFEVARVVQPTEQQGELHPPTEYSSVIPAWQRDSSAVPHILETTGLNPHAWQLELLDKRRVHQQSIVAKLKEVGAGHLAGKMLDCHTEQAWAQCQGCRKVKSFWNHCDLFFCPICQPRLARERSESIRWWANQVSNPKHIVLTARNTEALTSDYVAWFLACFTKLRRQKHARTWQSGTWSLEITNEGRGWHLHLHVLVNAVYVNIPALCESWAKLVKQDYAIVNVKDVRGTDYVREVAKYAVKGNDLAKWSGGQIVNFIYAFRQRRNFGVFGKLHGLRTKLRDFLQSIRENYGKCECGCNSWKVYSDAEWQWKLATDGPVFASIPPPVDTQRRLRLDI